MVKRIKFTNRPGVGLVGEVIPELSDRVPWRYVVTTWTAQEVRGERGEGGEAPAAQEVQSGEGVVAEEVVLRGVEWLEEHRVSGGEGYRHLALTRRAPGLTREEFRERWRNHAGRAGGAVIPAEARGEAYVQNHVVTGNYDAINEVWFTTRANLKTRVEWFEEHRDDLADDLFQAPLLVAVRELHAGSPIDRGSR